MLGGTTECGHLEIMPEIIIPSTFMQPWCNMLIIPNILRFVQFSTCFIILVGE
jgi:hypothetical protein